MVIEYNCRFGDPETEVVIPRLENDLVELFLATSQNQLYKINIKVNPKAAVTIVAVSGGYPNEYATGKQITGQGKNYYENTTIFHAGTKNENGNVLTNGGRVLAVTSFGENITKAAKQSSNVLGQINFDGIYFRSDIGYEFQGE
jgi:phosphoribosylamine--glycine ligase